MCWVEMFFSLLLKLSGKLYSISSEKEEKKGKNQYMAY